MVFPTPGRGQKVAHPVRAASNLQAQEATRRSGGRTYVTLVALKAGCLSHRTADLLVAMLSVEAGNNGASESDLRPGELCGPLLLRLGHVDQAEC